MGDIKPTEAHFEISDIKLVICCSYKCLLQQLSRRLFSLIDITPALSDIELR